MGKPLNSQEIEKIASRVAKMIQSYTEQRHSMSAEAANVPSMTQRAIADELAAMRAHLGRIEQFIIMQTVARPTRKQQAKKLGVHPNTLRNREKRAALRVLVNGGL